MGLSAELSIRVDDLSGIEIRDFLAAHIEDMRAVSPPESKHALDLEALRASNVTFWSVWHGVRLVGCGALKTLDNHHAELKSMRVAPDVRGLGVGVAILTHITEAAREAGFTRISLETGSMPFFAPARRLYERFGFSPCPPFADYQADPNSSFYTLAL